MTSSVNNRIVVEAYVKKGLEPKVQGGIATPGQRDGLKGLKVLLDGKLPDGTLIPKGSVVYIREKALHEHAWASNPLTCDTLPGKFLIVDSTFVEFFSSPDDAA